MKRGQLVKLNEYGNEFCGDDPRVFEVVDLNRSFIVVAPISSIGGRICADRSAELKVMRDWIVEVK
jgi:hypothetical protein